MEVTMEVSVPYKWASIIKEVLQSLSTAEYNHIIPPKSTHEGYAIILEEVDELWEEVKKDDDANAKTEAQHVVVAALRFIKMLADRGY